MPFYAAVIDEDHTIVVANRVLEEDFPGAVGKKCYEILHRSDKPIQNCPLVESIERNFAPVEKEIYEKSQEKWFLSSIYPLKFTIDGKRLFLHFARDVTGRKMTEEFEEERMKFFERINELLKFVNKIVRHDVLNQFNVILSAIDVYKETGEEKFLEIIEDAANKGVEILKKTRDFDNLFKIRELRIGEIVKEAAKGYDVEVEITGDCEALVSEALILVFENLISNSVKHGKATKVSVDIKSEGEWCVVRVADNGTGIPEEIRERIFDEGFSHGERAGSGMGLFIAKRVVELCGGSIELEAYILKF